MYTDAMAARDKVSDTVAKLHRSHLSCSRPRFASQDSTLPLMGNLRWKGMPLALADPVTEDGSMKSSGWDWLANGLEIARVRATLCQFQVHDRFKAGAIRYC